VIRAVNKKTMSQTTLRMCHDSGIEVIPHNGSYVIGFKPDKSLLCIGCFAQSDLADMYDYGDLVFIRFDENGKPHEFYPPYPTYYDVQVNELKIKVGSFFVYNSKRGNIPIDIPTL